MQQNNNSKEESRNNAEDIIEKFKELYKNHDYYTLYKQAQLSENIEGLYYQAKCLIKMLEIDKAMQVAEIMKDFDKNYNIEYNTEHKLYLYNEIMSEIESQRKIISNGLTTNTQYIHYLNFINVLYKNGVYINKLDVSFPNSYNRCVIATEDINNKEIILSIPLNSLITLELAQESEIGKFLTPEILNKLNSPNHCVFSSYLLQEMNKKELSKWSFYFNMLPTSFDSFPIFYKAEELEWLKETQFYSTLLIKQREILQDYNILCKSIEQYKQFSYESFLKVRMIVASRIFGVKIKNKKSDVLAPYADMLNHHRPKQTYWNYEDESESFVISASVPIKKGEEVFDSYGRKCNSRFLLNYGFALEDNEDNEYKITLFIDKNIKNFSLKKDIYDPQNLLFLGFLRVLCSEGIISVRARTIENEKKCLNKIMEKFLDILSKYSTSVEEDKELLKNPNLSFNIRNCIIMRMGEKEILEYFISFSKYVLNYLNKIPNKHPNIIFDKFIQENYKQFQL
jgi:histone-lysine N-methyltransferase SETD3